MPQNSSEFTAFERFFLFCAGSDLNLLKKCRRAEQIKHMGFGSLVLIPALLGLVSMTYALSSLDGLNDQYWLILPAALLWSLIIFAFDRFIVSTHRRKTSDLAELKRPAFYLRLAFALILGIVISHPLVMLYFKGSVADQMKANLADEKQMISEQFEGKMKLQKQELAGLDSIYWEKVAMRDQQADRLAAEIDGVVIKNAKGEIETTGIRGMGPSAENKLNQLEVLSKELKELKAERDQKQIAVDQQLIELNREKDSTLAAFSLSTDYLHQERALEQLKKKEPIVATTQWLIISLFIFIDLLPFIFKTFSTYGLYDKVLSDEEESLKTVEAKDQTIFWQEKLDSVGKF